MLPRLLCVLYLLLLGCSATCLRDSDCMGNSVCTQNRCVLIVRGDASVIPPTSGGADPGDDGDDGEDPTPTPRRDAGGEGDAGD